MQKKNSNYYYFSIIIIFGILIMMMITYIEIIKNDKSHFSSLILEKKIIFLV
jgi:hypothetical protein